MFSLRRKSELDGTFSALGHLPPIWRPFKDSKYWGIPEWTGAWQGEKNSQKSSK
jgi:hypothetical protein